MSSELTEKLTPGPQNIFKEFTLSNCLVLESRDRSIIEKRPDIFRILSNSDSIIVDEEELLEMAN